MGANFECRWRVMEGHPTRTIAAGDHHPEDMEAVEGVMDAGVAVPGGVAAPDPAAGAAPDPAAGAAIAAPNQDPAHDQGLAPHLSPAPSEDRSLSPPPSPGPARDPDPE